MKEIKLTGQHGGTAIVSDIDYSLISKYNRSWDRKKYAVGGVEGIKICMHHLVFRQYNTNIPKDKIIDHINRNRLDNRRENLRLVTAPINAQNISKRKNASSIYRGVCFVNSKNKYRASLIINGEKIYLGYHNKEVDAAVSVDMYLVHNKHDHIQLNFPEKKNDYLIRKYVPHTRKKQCKYIGVSKHKNKFQAKLCHNKINIFIKYSNKEIICAKAYDKYIVDNNIPGKKLNFPKKYPNYDPTPEPKLIIKTEYKNTNNANIIRLVIKSHPNKKVLIDKEDYDKVKYYAWNFSDSGYLRAHVNDKRSVRLTHFLMDIKQPYIFVDHIDSNILNNSKNNLRISNPVKNGQNKSKSSNATSKYYGVYPIKKNNKWQSFIINNHKNTGIGQYSEEMYAARARDLYVLIHLPDSHYKLNFQWNNKDIEKWKKKLWSPKHPNRWIAKTKEENLKDEMGRIVDSFNKKKMLLFEKLNENKNNRVKEDIDRKCKELGV